MVGLADVAAKTTAPSLEELLARAGVDDEGHALVTWARRRAAEILESTPADMIERVRGGAGIASTGHGPGQVTAPPPQAPSADLPELPAATSYGPGEAVPVDAAAGEDEDEGDVEEIEEIEEFELLDDDEVEILEEDDEDEGEARAPVPPAPAGTPVGVALPEPVQAPDDRDDAGHTAPSSTGMSLEESPAAGETGDAVAGTGHEVEDDDDDLFRDEELDLDLSDM